jgi:hypothetical protein
VISQYATDAPGRGTKDAGAGHHMAGTILTLPSLHKRSEFTKPS